MSVASQLLSRAFTALRSTNGETVIFRGAEVLAIINRDPFAKNVKTPDFNPKDTSRIEFETSQVNGIPRVGEDFIDGYGLMHRVQSVRRNGETYVAQCEVYDLPGQALRDETPEFITNEDGIVLQAA
jgi:hypothetical protein